MRRIGEIAIFTILLLFASSVPAYADQGGRVLKPSTCCSGSLDGIYSYITPETLTPASNGGCVLESTLVNEGSIGDQLEAGVTKCKSGSSIDGTCGNNGSITRFYEEDFDGVYTCQAEGTQSISQAVSYSVRLYQASGGHYGAYISGTLYGTVAGYTPSKTNALVWDETTPK